MDFKKYLDQSRRQLDRPVQKILNEWLKEVQKIDSKLVPLANAFIQANFGGKGTRGTLVKLGYQLTSSKFNKEILKIGAAYEIFHTAILAHDDIIDQSPTRRNQPSLYKKVGKAQAITLADLAFFLTIKIISESRFEDKIKNQALNLFSKTMIDTTIGQMLDIAHGDPVTTAKLKTARYTISGPLTLGAILAGADQKLLGLLGKFGQNLGIAFQIRDDILDKEAVESKRLEALKYVRLAKNYIPKITSDKKMSTLLEQLAEYMVERNK